MSVSDRKAPEWFVRKPRHTARFRLFLFPHAGGGASTFRGWEADFPSHVELCAAQLPGRETRFKEAPSRRVAPLAAALVDAMLPLMDVPFALFGHSMGAVVAYEVARFLHEHRLPPPRHLFVSSYPGPAAVSTRRHTIHHLPDDAFIRELRRIGGTPSGVLESPELLQLCLPLLRSDFELCETWSPSMGQVLDCPVYALGGLDDASVSEDALRSWTLQTTGDRNLMRLPGDHFYHVGSSRHELTQIIATSMGSVVL